LYCFPLSQFVHSNVMLIRHVLSSQRHWELILTTCIKSDLHTCVVRSLVTCPLMLLNEQKSYEMGQMAIDLGKLITSLQGSHASWKVLEIKT